MFLLSLGLLLWIKFCALDLPLSQVKNVFIKSRAASLDQVLCFRLAIKPS